MGTCRIQKASISNNVCAVCAHVPVMNRTTAHQFPDDLHRSIDDDRDARHFKPQWCINLFLHLNAVGKLRHLGLEDHTWMVKSVSSDGVVVEILGREGVFGRHASTYVGPLYGLWHSSPEPNVGCCC